MLSSSWETNISSASQIPRILCDPKVHYRVYKSPTPVCILSQINPVMCVENPLWYYPPICAWVSLSGGLSPSRFPTKILYAPLRHTCYMPRPSHSAWFESTWLIFGKAYKLWSSSLCSLHQFPVTSSLLGSKYLPQHSILVTPLMICNYRVLCMYDLLEKKHEACWGKAMWQNGTFSRSSCLFSQTLGTRIVI